MPKYNYPRLEFPKGEQRKFLEKIFEKSGLGIQNLAKIINVSPRTIRDWKREKFNISEDAIDKFCKFFDITPPNDEKLLISNWLKRGNKVKQQVEVPDWVQKSDSYKIACLKGLMDTDGCVTVSTHKVGLKRYVYYNPCFANRSKPLLNFVAGTLREQGLHPSVVGERIWLYNKAEIRAYFDIIGSSNARLLKFKETSPSGMAADC